MSLCQLEYSYFFGQLVWKSDCGRGRAGTIAGYISSEGYRQIQLNYKRYLAHRLIWEMFNGPIPEGFEVDHKNGQRDCNHIWNLRLATNNQNKYNRKLQSNNTSGVKGVSWCKVTEKWLAQIMVKGQGYRCRFTDKQDAVKWVKNKRVELHGEFANNGT